jgi:mRNA-degrading endonuclease RelE of RelBE toxin-antitoxin system
MNWNIHFTRKAKKQLDKLPIKVQAVTRFLVAELELSGPVPSGWPNFGKLKGNKKGVVQYHCHLIKGNPTQPNPTYVCVLLGCCQ